MIRTLAALLLCLSACGTGAQSSDVCRKIEQARCRRAAQLCPALGIQGDPALEECLGSARDRCEHGTEVADPGASATDRCVKAIEATTSCAVVEAPETAPECMFLFPTELPEASIEAASSADAGAADAPLE
jgi:hypothetical protein